jgi:N,N'-diacetylchitobiose transport system substrate-binding protein
VILATSDAGGGVGEEARMTTRRGRARWRSAPALLAAATLALAACGGGEDGSDEASPLPRPSADARTTLQVWLMDASQPTSLVKDVTKRFAERYPNVTVDVQYQQWADIQERLAATLGTEAAPDVVELGNSLTARYADQGLLTDLSVEAESLGVPDMLPGLAAAGAWEGRRYGIPYYGGDAVVTYRTDQFKDAGLAVPTSLAELAEAAGELQAANEKAEGYSAFWFPGQYWQGALPFVWAHGGEVATQAEDGTWTAGLDSAEARAGLTQLADLVEAYSRAPKEEGTQGNVAAFAAGRVGMMLDSWWVPGALDTGALEGKVGAFPLPGVEAGSLAPVYIGGSDLVVPARASEPGLAVEWIGLLTGVASQEQLARAGVIPNQEAAFAGHTGNAYLKVADTAALGARFTPVSPRWPDVMAKQVLETMLGDIFTGRASVDEATSQASTSIADTLNG